MQKKQVTIHIGQLHASKNPTIIYTLLGSCVAVCLHDPVVRIGGMNHILIPGQADLNQAQTAARYGANATDMLIRRIVRLGGDPKRLVAKIFGGSHMFKDIAPDKSPGKKNVQSAVASLEAANITIKSRNIGGTDTRKVYFHTDTGEVFLKRVLGGTVNRLAEAERQLYKAFRQKIK